jgi:hypothetical protein
MAEESAGIEPKPSRSKRILGRISYWTTIITLILVILGGLNETVQKIKSRKEHTEKTFLDGFQDYVKGLIGQIGALTPGQVRGTFFDRLETCHYGWKLRCQPIKPAPDYHSNPDLPAILNCLGVPEERFLGCAKTYRANHSREPASSYAASPFDPAILNCLGAPSERILDCEKTYRATHLIKPPDYGAIPFLLNDPATLNCLAVPSERFYDCRQTYLVTHLTELLGHNGSPFPLLDDTFGPTASRRKLTYPQFWLFPSFPTLETVRGLPDAAWETGKTVRKAGWLATAIFGVSSLFAIVSLIALIGSIKSEDWTFLTFVIMCWLVVGVPYLVSGVAWIVQWLMKAVFGIAYGLLSLVILGVGFGSVLTVILEVKHLQPHLSPKT